MADNIFDKIREDHDEFKDMLIKLTDEAENPDEEAVKEDTFSEFKMELKAHIKAEEETLYKALLADSTSRELALVGIEEHRMGSEMLNNLDGASSKWGEQWNVQLNVLRHLLEKHMEAEEEETIPIVQDLLDEQRVNNLSAKFESIEESLEQKQIQ